MLGEGWEAEKTTEPIVVEEISRRGYERLSPRPEDRIQSAQGHVRFVLIYRFDKPLDKATLAAVRSIPHVQEFVQC